MGVKVIYFVRHGETVLNAKGIRQGVEGPLTEKGREQALATARKFPKGKGRPEIMIVSPFQRTRETADIIADELRIAAIEYNDLLAERRNPTEIIGHAGDEEMVRRIVDRIDKGFHEDNFRFSDEENFTDLRDRAGRLLEFLVARPEQHLICISHAIFLKMVVSYMLLGDDLTASEYNKLSYLNPLDNAGLTICTYTTGFLRKPKWKLIMWNDQVQIDEQ